MVGTLTGSLGPCSATCGFNPSVGIQVVGTGVCRLPPSRRAWFQSLGRDSGGWDPADKALGICWPQPFQSLGRDSGGWDRLEKICLGLARSVSIPRSGFRWLGLQFARDEAGDPGLVSIPRSGFRWLGHFYVSVPALRILAVSIPRSGFRWLGHPAI